MGLLGKSTMEFPSIPEKNVQATSEKIREGISERNNCYKNAKKKIDDQLAKGTQDIVKVMSQKKFLEKLSMIFFEGIS